MTHIGDAARCPKCNGSRFLIFPRKGEIVVGCVGEGCEYLDYITALLAHRPRFHEAKA